LDLVPFDLILKHQKTMEKYFLGICIVVASLIYVWGNQWEVTATYATKLPTKYNKITGETYLTATRGKPKWTLIPND
jgi:hypothetical protein